MTDTRTLYTSKYNQHKPSEKGLALVPDNVMRQELKTYIPVEGGFKVVTRTRKFRGITHEESLVEEVILKRYGPKNV